MENNNQWQNFLSFLSLAMKACKLSIGEGRATDSIRKGKASLIILSKDASENTVKRFSDMGAYRSIDVIKTVDRYELGHFVGRKFAVIIAVCDDSFSDGLKKRIIIE